jgi:hypothetical protein
MPASCRRTRAAVLAATLFSVAACTGGDGKSETASAGQRAASLPSTGRGEEIPMSSIDPLSRYFLVSVKPMPHDHYEALTRRQGNSGIFYARREIDCHGARRVRFIGMGDTREEAQRDAPNPGEMAEPVEGSTDLGVVQYVCRKVAR